MSALMNGINRYFVRHKPGLIRLRRQSCVILLHKIGINDYLISIFHVFA
jgi:hypothetical protein